jgi:hypothetical protein
MSIHIDHVSATRFLSGLLQDDEAMTAGITGREFARFVALSGVGQAGWKGASGGTLDLARAKGPMHSDGGTLEHNHTVAEQWARRPFRRSYALRFQTISPLKSGRCDGGHHGDVSSIDRSFRRGARTRVFVSVRG